MRFLCGRKNCFFPTFKLIILYFCRLVGLNSSSERSKKSKAIQLLPTSIPLLQFSSVVLYEAARTHHETLGIQKNQQEIQNETFSKKGEYCALIRVVLLTQFLACIRWYRSNRSKQIQWPSEIQSDPFLLSSPWSIVVQWKYFFPAFLFQKTSFSELRDSEEAIKNEFQYFAVLYRSCGAMERQTLSRRYIETSTLSLAS